MLAKKIKVFVNKNKDKTTNVNDHKELVRPYVNSVTIKLYKDKSYLQNSIMNDNFLRPKSNFQMHQQDFRITGETTFDKLKEGA